MMLMKRTLIVLFALFSLSAIADELTLADQKVTMADMRALASSIEAMATDTNAYPDVSFDELEKLLSPTYIKTVPRVDAWGTPFAYVANGSRYRFVSAGADRKFEESSQRLGPQRVEGVAQEDPNADIIFEDGSFIQYPAALAPKPRRVE